MIPRSVLRFPYVRLFVIAVLAAALLGALTASLLTRQAAGQTTSSTLEACINRYTGAVRMSTPGRAITCSSAETRVEWDQQGPQGPEGPAGPMGPAGPAAVVPELGALQPMTVTCENGDTVLSGGYEFIYDTDGFAPPQVVTNRPYNQSQSQQGWMVQVFHGDSRLIADVFAICESGAGGVYQVNQRHDTGNPPGGGGNDGGGDDGR